MDKKYQVFISSTFTDLVEPRRRVLQMILNMNCIPAGMELFPAADEKQLVYIKKIIDLCDYYILLIGARYGSVAEDGISFTEKEFDYAVSKDVKVIALIHDKPEKIKLEKKESKESQRKLDAFREKVGKDRLVRTWSKPEELEGQVAIALAHAISSYPAIGWVRANIAASEEILAQLNSVRVQNEELKERVSQLANMKTPQIDDIAGIDELTTINYTYRGSRSRIKSNCKISWSELFSVIAPHIRKPSVPKVVKSAIEAYLANKTQESVLGFSINEQDFQVISIQMESLGLVIIRDSATSSGGRSLFWALTAKGEAEMYKLLSVRRKK